MNAGEPPITTPPPSPRRFVCGACGQVHLAWSPRCVTCHSLDGLKLTTIAAEMPVISSPAAFRPSPPPEKFFERPRIILARSPEPELTSPVEELVDVADDEDDDPTPITDVKASNHTYEPTGLAPLDAVLGGGLVKASVILLASPPGSGKTSLTLQALVGLGHLCLYASGEETKEQVTVTARRINALSPDVLLMHTQDPEKIFAKARKFGVRTIAIDSIQKMRCSDVNGRAGTPGQLKECSERFRLFAKDSKTTIWLICHVTTDGEIQGPKTIEHDADVVLELVPGPKFEGNERILRCPANKNRFGDASVVGRFMMTATGLVPVDPDGWNEPL